MASRTVSVSGGPPQVGSWTIETGCPGDGSVAAFDWLARQSVGIFSTAFRELAGIERVSADLMWIGPDRRISRVSETVPATVDAHGELVVPADADLITAVFVHATSALLGGDGVLNLVYACVLEDGDGDVVNPVDSAVTLTVGGRRWLGPSDAANRALLARALRDWERWTGRPISEWSSSEHPNRIERYGFTDPS
jgi:hypothetical protein